MPTWLIELMNELREAGYPAQYHTTRERVERLEAWLGEETKRRMAEWRAAGEPEHWYQDLSVKYCGPNFGPMLKGVEVLPMVVGAAMPLTPEQAADHVMRTMADWLDMDDASTRQAIARIIAAFPIPDTREALSAAADTAYREVMFHRAMQFVQYGVALEAQGSRDFVDRATAALAEVRHA